MLPPRILDTFAKVPVELVDPCRLHRWEDLTRPAADGMRSIRDVLVHTMNAEANWIRHVIAGDPRVRMAPDSFGDLEAILSVWAPQREGTMAWLRGLVPEDRLARRPLPWNSQESTSIEEIVWHVVTHEQYHRGQVFTRLALLGRRDLPDHDLLR